MDICNKYHHNYTYPGHALVIACCIMDKYPSLAEARKPCINKKTGEKHGFPEALGDNDIPGAGGCVYCALDVLEIEDIDKAIERANYYWQGECGEAYASRYDDGMNEAKELEPLFREMRAKWR